MPLIVRAVCLDRNPAGDVSIKLSLARLVRLNASCAESRCQVIRAPQDEELFSAHDGREEMMPRGELLRSLNVRSMPACPPHAIAAGARAT